MQDTNPAETLDKFLWGLNTTVREPMLLSDPRTFEDAALAAERIAGIRGEGFAWVHYGNATNSGPVPMEFGTAQGVSPPPAAPQRRSSTITCFYCKK